MGNRAKSRFHLFANRRKNSVAKQERRTIRTFEPLEERQLLSVSDPIGLAAASVAVCEPQLEQGETIDLSAIAASDVAITVAPDFSAAEVEGATLVVTTLDDVVDDSDGVLSLREAIGAAQDGDTITFFEPGAIKLSGTELKIVKSITIDATSVWDAENNMPGITVDGDAKSRVFFIDGNANLELVGVTVTNGKVNGYGGGIYAGGALSVVNSEISNNSAFFGGGVYAHNGATITNSVISGNTASNSNSSPYYVVYPSGGGIYAAGELTIEDSVISDNEVHSSSYHDTHGGGIYATRALTITNSTISGNRSTGDGLYTFACYGVGIYAAAKLTITGSAISGNNGDGINGDGIYARDELLISNSEISDNDGVGIYASSENSNNSVTITRSVISGNSDSGIDVARFSELTIANCSISRNSGAGITVAGITVNYGGSGTISNCAISGNAGRGVVVGSKSKLSIVSSTISCNAGGGVYAYDELTVENCAIFGNVSEEGGGIFSRNALTVVNSTISGNSALNGTGGICLTDEAKLKLYNTILALNLGGDLNSSKASSSLPEITWENCLIGVDPQFVSPPVFTDGKLANSESLDLRLSFRSLAIDNGNNDYCDWEYDLDNKTRISGSRSSTELVDIGAYEHQDGTAPIDVYSGVVTTSDDVCDSTDGKISLREALFYADSGDTITFAETLNGSTIKLGGFALSVAKALAIDAGVLSDKITLDGDKKSRVFSVISDGVLFDNMRIINGYTTYSPGGGICSNGELTIANCAICGNSTSSDNAHGLGYSLGGGIYAKGALTVTDSEISGNVVSVTGDFYVNSYGHAAYAEGGGIYAAYTSAVTIKNSTISDNVVSGYESRGGGVFADYRSSLTITNSAIIDNTASSSEDYVSQCGGIYLDCLSALTITNSTISGNKATSCGGIYSGDYSGYYYNNYWDERNTYNLYNTIVALNSNGDLGGYYEFNGFNVLTADVSQIKGERIYEYDPESPLFVNAEKGDYRLAENSQAVDLGNDEYAYAVGLDENSKDLEGNRRFSGNAIDLGAYEYEGSFDCPPVFAPLTPATASTGSTYEATVSAVDREGAADRIVYELIGTNPTGITLNSETGAISWAIPSDYLAKDVQSQEVAFSVKATEQYLQSDGSYLSGLSTEKTFHLLVVNSGYEPVDEGVAPVFDPLGSQTIASGETFVLTVVAKAIKTNDDGSSFEYDVRYSLGEDAPSGMTIDSASGAITWTVPGDYFSDNSVASLNLTVPVVAKTIVNGAVSDKSATKSFTLTVTNTNYEPPKPPAAPSNLTVGDFDASTNSVAVSWTDNSDNETGFLIVYSNDGENWQTVSIAANKTSATLTGLFFGTTYAVGVAALNSVGNSDLASTTFETPYALTAPSNLTIGVFDESTNSVSVSWTDNSDNETGFVVLYSTDDENWQYVVTDANETSATLTGLALGATYSVSVAATNDAGNSAFASNSFTTPAPQVDLYIDIRGANPEYIAPVTGEAINLVVIQNSADIDDYDRYEIIQTDWWITEPSAPPTTDPSVKYVQNTFYSKSRAYSIIYTPTEGKHGTYTLKCQVYLRDKTTNTTFYKIIKGNFDVFFKALEFTNPMGKGADPVPNWLYYWLRDGAVSTSVPGYDYQTMFDMLIGENETRIVYMPDNKNYYGMWGIAEDVTHISALNLLPEEPYRLYWGGGNFKDDYGYYDVLGGVSGIDGVAALFAHEFTHRENIWDKANKRPADKDTGEWIYNPAEVAAAISAYIADHEAMPDDLIDAAPTLKQLAGVNLEIESYTYDGSQGVDALEKYLGRLMYWSPLNGLFNWFNITPPGVKQYIWKSGERRFNGSVLELLLGSDSSINADWLQNESFDYSENGTGTSPDFVDTWHLGFQLANVGHIDRLDLDSNYIYYNTFSCNDYYSYGDNELQSRLAEIKGLSSPEKDWSCFKAKIQLGRQCLDKKIQYINLQDQNSGSSSSVLIEESALAEVIDTASTASEKKDIYVSSHNPDIQQVEGVQPDSMTEQGVDLDGNGEVDHFDVTAIVSVENDGSYSVCVLCFTAGHLVFSNAYEIELQAGTSEITVSIPSCYLDSVLAPNDTLMASYVIDANGEFLGDYEGVVVQDYSSAEFEKPLTLSSLNETTVDRNDNGLIDELKLDFSLSVNYYGTYTIVNSLRNADGEAIETFYEERTLEPGVSQDFSLSFDGGNIYREGESGPYTLTTSIIDPNVYYRSPVKWSGNLYTTQAYSTNDFEGAQADFSKQFSDFARDVDSDGKYDELAISVSVDVAAPGNYCVYGHLVDEEGNNVGSAYGAVEAETGIYNVELTYDSITLAAHKIDGAYTLSYLYLIDLGTGQTVDALTNAYTTGEYSIADFNELKVEFTGDNRVSTPDANHNGKYDSLDISLKVNVNVPGDYILLGYVCDVDGNTIYSVSERERLSAGEDEFNVSISGPTINALEANGPYTFRALAIYDNNSELVAYSDIVETDEYQFTDFENQWLTVSGDISDYLDETGTYLCVAFKATSENGGDFNASARLMDSDGVEICRASTDVALVAGEETEITLKFNYNDVIRRGVPGELTVKDFSLYNQRNASEAVYIAEFHKIQHYGLNAPEWNLADYSNYKKFKLDATLDSNVTATLYGLKQDGRTYVELKAWDFIGANATATITGRNVVAEDLWVTESAAALLGEVVFNGGELLLDQFTIDGTAGDDDVKIGTETVTVETPIFTTNPYEKALENYRNILGETSPVYQRIAANLDAAYQRLSKFVTRKTTTWGVVEMNGMTSKFIGTRDVAINTGAGDDSVQIDALHYNYAISTEGDNNELDFANAKDRVNVDLGANYRQCALIGDGGTLKLDGTFTTVTGTALNDRVVGTDAGLTFVGNGGSDSVTLVGGSNSVFLVGPRQSVIARGNGVYDVTIEQGDYSVVNAGGVTKRGAVSVGIEGKNVSVFGGLGTLSGGVEGDYATVSAGATQLVEFGVVGDYAVVTTGLGADIVSVAGDYATVTTGAGDDVVYAFGAYESINLGAGNDKCVIEDGDSGKVGGNHVWGDSGADVIVAAQTTGINYLYAGVGNDVVIGGAGEDYIYANAGDNILIGYAGVDRIYGGAGRDVLVASATDALANVDVSDSAALEALYAQAYDAWNVEKDLDAVVQLLGEHCLEDGEKDWIYRGGGRRNLIYASELDADFENALERSPFEDELQR